MFREDSWYPTKVEVKSPEGDIYNFPIYRWITDSEVHLFREGKGLFFLLTTENKRKTRLWGGWSKFMPLCTYQQFLFPFVACSLSPEGLWGQPSSWQVQSTAGAETARGRLSVRVWFIHIVHATTNICPTLTHVCFMIYTNNLNTIWHCYTCQGLYFLYCYISFKVAILNTWIHVIYIMLAYLKLLLLKSADILVSRLSKIPH